MCALFGLLILLITLVDIPPLRQRDALFGLTTRTVLVLAGVLHLAVSGYLLAGRDLMNQGIVVLSASWYHVLYGVGMAWVMKVAAPFPAVVAVAWKVGVSAKVADICWKLFIAYQVLGGVLVVALEWGRLKRLRMEIFLKYWVEVRKNEVTRCPSNLRNLTNREMSHKAVPEFKFSCPSCGQHIRCDECYSGSQIICPSCKNEIVVPQANASQS
jgi:hypothetical protein